MGLFGKKSKPNFGELYKDPPQYQLAPGSYDKYQGQIQSLVDLFGRRSRGEDQFDYMKYLYEPQEAALNRQYGIGTAPGDIYSQGAGSIQRTLAGLNQRGLGDAGTSGLILAQLEADRNRQLAELFGQARIAQRGDIDQAYSNLGELYPAQFEAAQIQPNINYANAMANFNQDFNRTNAHQNYEATKPGSPWPALLGAAAGGIIGGPAGASIGSSIGGQFGGGGWAQPQSSGGGLFGGMNLGNIFGSGGGGAPRQGYSTSPQNYLPGAGGYNAVKYPYLFGSPGF
jgi:hypothetical protein